MSEIKTILISSIPLTLVFVLGIVFQNWIIPIASFEIRLGQPWADLSIDSQTSINISVVDTSPFLRHYKYDIALAADRLNGEGLPSGINIVFDPAVYNCRNGFQSTMSIITDSSVSAGTYTLQVSGYGTDGTVRSAFLVLDVHE